LTRFQDIISLLFNQNEKSHNAVSFILYCMVSFTYE